MNKFFRTLLLFLAATSCSLGVENPTLLLFISIDQMRADYLERFADQYTGAFRRLNNEGIVYLNADLNYAKSVTGAGHATLSTGAYPQTHGIPSNEWIDPLTRKSVYCVEDKSAGPVNGEGGGFSPRNLKVPAIGDWLKSISPASKSITVSGKDRAAILMGGLHATYSFWFDKKSGHMVTSDYYTKSLPDWVTSFNRSNWIEKNVPDAWTKLFPDSVYDPYGPDEFEAEVQWGDNTSFPHLFQRGKKKDRVMTSPFGDLHVLAFTREALYAERLGQRGVIDYLSIDLSSTDYIGHDYGPDSHEIHDHLLRLDRALGDLLDEIFKVLGQKKVLIALCADHGVMPLPEYLTQHKKEFARRINPPTEVRPRIEELGRALQREWNVTGPLIQQNAFLDYASAMTAGIDSLRLERRIREELLKIESIADVFFRRELLNAHTPHRPYIDKYRRSYYAPLGEDFIIQYCEGCLLSSRSTGTSHGSPYRYDTHVAMVLWGAQLKAARVHRPVNTVDIAPTMAKLLGIPSPSWVEGNVLKEISN